MTVYGLTGQTGAGKSTVADKLKSRGFFIVDGDEIAREIVAPGSPVLCSLAQVFGADIIRSDGSLNRKELAKRAFSSEEGTKKLNEITHGEIDRVMRERLIQAENAGFERAVIDAAALLESPSRTLCEKIIVVVANEKSRLERIMARDDLNNEDALRRIKAQKSEAYYRERADYIIENNGDGLDEKINAVMKSIHPLINGSESP